MKKKDKKVLGCMAHTILKMNANRMQNAFAIKQAAVCARNKKKGKRKKKGPRQGILN